MGAVPDNGRQNPTPASTVSPTASTNTRFPGAPVSAGIGADGRQQTWSQEELYRIEQLNNYLNPSASPSKNTKPLTQSSIVTPTTLGQQTVNDDASVNTGSTVVAEAGRESDTNTG